MTATLEDARVLRMRARFGGVDELTIVDAQERLFDLSCLMWFGYAVTAADERRTSTANLSKEASRRADSVARSALTQTRVQRISYNSPLEVFLLISGAAGSAAVVGRTIMGLHEATQRARRTAAETQTFVLAHELIREGLRSRMDLDLDALLEFTEGAGRALADTSSLNVEPE